jgi:O-antigen ligase
MSNIPIAAAPFAPVAGSGKWPCWNRSRTFRTGAPIRIPAERAAGPYLQLLSLTMAAGTFVLFEPAPVDLALMVLLGFALVSGKLRFTSAQGMPLLLLGVMAGANLISMANAPDVSRATWYCLVTVYLMLSWVLFVGLVSKYGDGAVRCLLNGYIAGGVLTASIATLAYFQVIPFQDTLLLWGRTKGFFKDPNVYGPYLVPIALYALAKFEIQTRKFHQACWFAICLMSVVGLFLSFSRACWINVISAVAVYFTLSRLTRRNKAPSRKRSVRLAIAMAVSATLLVVALKSPAVSRMMEIRLGSAGLQDYDADRFNTQAMAVESSIEQPFGLGPGQAEEVFNYATHNTYLRVLSENGLLGFLSFATFAVLTLIRAIRFAAKPGNENWRLLMTVTAASLVGHLINSFVIDTLHWRHIWLFFALPWAAHQRMYRADAGRAGFSRPINARQASASFPQRDSSPARTQVRPPEPVTYS